MKYTIIYLSFALFPIFGSSKIKLNSMEANLFRLPSIATTESLMLPWYQDEPKSIKDLNYHFLFDFFVYGNADLVNLYEDVMSKNDKRIVESLNDSFGKPLDAMSRLSVRGRFNSFEQGIYLNTGEVFILNNPVFPELTGVILVDFSSISSYEWVNNLKKIRAKPSLTVSRRKSLKKSLSASDILLDTSSYKVNKVSWYWSIETSLDLEYKFDFIKTELKLRSIPIYGQKFSYWDTLLGIETLDLMKNNRYLNFFNLYASYSPFYGGKYHVRKTYLAGIAVGLSDHLSFNIFSSGHYYINAVVKLRLENFDFTFYTKKDSYDDYFFQESRSIGFNTRFQF